MKLLLSLMTMITFCFSPLHGEDSIMERLDFILTVESTSEECELKAEIRGQAILDGALSYLNITAYGWHSLYGRVNVSETGTLLSRETHIKTVELPRTTTPIPDGKYVDFSGRGWTRDYTTNNDDAMEATDAATVSCPDQDMDGDGLVDSVDPCPTDPNPNCGEEPDPDPDPDPDPETSGGNIGILSEQNDSETPDDNDYFWNGIVRYKPWNDLVTGMSTSTITGLHPVGTDKTEDGKNDNPLHIITPETSFFDLLLVKSDPSNPINYGTFTDPREGFEDERRVLKRLSLKDYGVLFRDSNGDRFFDNLAEAKIFSEEELAKFSCYFPNSLYRLVLFDMGLLGGNDNYMIDPNDAIWDELFVWFDLNEDGIVDELEIQDLNTLGFTGIGILVGKDETEKSVDSESYLKVYSGEVHTHSINSFMLNDIR